MVDSRDKGKRAEMQVRDMLRQKTNLSWERVPGSGAYGQTHGLKGDVYLPPSQGHLSKYCYEVKHFKDDQISSNILNIAESTFEKWWQQCEREAGQMNMKPALVFKKDRGTWLIAIDSSDPNIDTLLERPHFTINKKGMEVVIGLFEPWIYHMKIEELIK